MLGSIDHTELKHPRNSPAGALSAAAGIRTMKPCPVSNSHTTQITAHIPVPMIQVNWEIQ